MGDFFAELRRRHIYRIGAGYVIVAWAITQVLDVLSQLFALPDSVAQPAVIVLVVGFPVTLVVAWLIEGKAHKGKTPASVSPATKVDWVIAGGLVLVLAVIGYQQLSLNNHPGASSDDLASSIAVLPFGNLGADPNNAAFVDGIHGELLTLLAKIGSLKVISRTSVMEYRDTPKNMREIGQELSVENILEGDVQRAGDTVRINVQLIDAETDVHLWAEIYEREMTAENLFVIQSEMATAIAAALQATLSPQEVARLGEVPTQNTLAYDFYLSAREYHRDPDLRTNLPLAVQQYQRATEEDPAFAVAFAHLSRAHAEMYWWSVDNTEPRLALSLAAVQQALALQPDLPEAHLAMAEYHYRSSRNYDEALRELAIAAQGMPGEPEVYRLRAPIYKRVGQWEAALADHARFVALDPRNALVLIESITLTNIALRDYTEAERVLDRALEIAPDADAAYRWKAEIYLYRDGDASLMKDFAEDPSMEFPNKQLWGWWAAIYERDTESALSYLSGWDEVVSDDLDEYRPKSLFYGATYQMAGQPDVGEPYFQAALAELEPVLETNVDDHRVHISFAEALAGLGELAGAVQAAEQAMALMPPSRDASSGRILQYKAIIRVFAVIEDSDRVIRELDDYLGASGGEWSIEGILSDPRLDFIQDDPGFIALVEKYRRQ